MAARKPTIAPSGRRSEVHGMGIQMFDHAHSEARPIGPDADAADEAERERPGAREGEEDGLDHERPRR